MNINDLNGVLRAPAGASATRSAAPASPSPSANNSANTGAVSNAADSATAERLAGRVNANPKGFGFVTTADGQEFFVSPSDMRRIVPGDEVVFLSVAGKKPGSFQAKVLGLLRRPSTVWQGELQQDGAEVLLRADGDAPCFCTLVVKELSACVPGVVVSVRVPELSGTLRNPRRLEERVHVRLERILGERTREGFLPDYALARYDFPLAFSRRVLAEAAEITAAHESGLSEHALADREDLRELPVVTIDGESTRDFDDAVHAVALDDGWELSVAISDVSYFVRPGSALEQAAYQRSTSVYLPRRVLPMLPENLSNGVCSLLPQTDRLALVLKLRLDRQAKVLETKVVRAVVRSAQRLTYNEVQSWSQGQFEVLPQVQPSLVALWDLYKVCEADRRAQGRLDFESPEPKLHTSDTGEETLEWVHRTEAHRLIEELMLLANRAVAEHLGRTLGEASQALYRHQPLPQSEDWAALQDLARLHGKELSENPSMGEIASFVNGLEGVSALHAELSARGTMQPAFYSAREPGHFSLNFPAYTHFTSPIRRYSDLVVHRLLLGEVTPEELSLEQVAQQCSERSRAGRLAERMVWDAIKKSHLWAVHLKESREWSAHLVMQSRRGIRAVLPEWQTSVYLEAEMLEQLGLSFDVDAENWQCPSRTLNLGSALSVTPLRYTIEGGKHEIFARAALF